MRLKERLTDYTATQQSMEKDYGVAKGICNICVARVWLCVSSHCRIWLNKDTHKHPNMQSDNVKAMPDLCG